MKIGYLRVSTKEQKLDRQEVIMQELGVEKLFIDKFTGTTKERAGLKEMLSFVRDGDCVVVESISRLARSTKDLLEIMEILQDKNVQFISQKENIDTNSPTGKFILIVFGAVAELEINYRKLRTQEGIEIAKEKGKYKGRQAIKIDENRFKEFYKEWKDNKITAKKFMQKMDLDRGTFYNRVKLFETTGKINIKK